MLVKNKILISSLLLFFCLLASSASAFSISPLKYTISIDPGKNKELVVSVTNDSNIEKEYQATVIGVQQDEKGRPVFKSNSDIAESWVKFNSEKIVLKSNEEKDFVFTITIPKNTPPGAHYVGLGVKEITEQNIGSQLVTILVLQVAGTANESLILEKFYSISNYFFNKNLLYFLEVKNSGNIDLSMTAQMETYNFQNQMIDSQSVNLGNRIFAQSKRSVEIKSAVSDKMFWPGKYYSMMIVNYGLTNQQIIGSANFWYWPVWFLFSVGVVVVGLLSVLIYRKKKHEAVE